MNLSDAVHHIAEKYASAILEKKEKRDIVAYLKQIVVSDEGLKNLCTEIYDFFVTIRGSLSKETKLAIQKLLNPEIEV